MYEIYKITCKANNKIYIGLTSVGIEKRWAQHVACAKNVNCKDAHSIFKKAIRKYGPNNFYIEVIDTANSAKEAEEKEMQYIKKYNSFAFVENSNGYNSTYGGDGARGYGMVPIVEIDIKSGTVIKEYQSLTDAEKSYGHRISHVYDLSDNIQTIKSTFFAYKNAIKKYTTDELKNLVYKYCNVIMQFDMDGNLIEIWENIESITNAKGYSQGNISSVIMGKRRLAYGYIWVVYNDFLEKKEITLRDAKTTAVPILQYTEDGILIAKYNSIIEAERITGISNSKITMVCKHKRNHAGGYIWCYENEPINILAIKNIKEKKEKLNDRKNNRLALKSKRISEIIDINSGNKYLSISEISDMTGISRKVIREVLNGKRENYQGHKWQYIK